MNVTLYLCNHLACQPQFGGGRSGLGDLCGCKHTQFSDYAKNGPCKDPENHPERFERVEDNNGNVTYWEKED